MAFVEAKNNTWDFSEVTDGTGLGDAQVEITNGDGRDYSAFEIVLNGTYVGEVREYGGIADGASGRINIEHRRVIRTAQIEATDTFTVGAEVFFHPGGGAGAGKIVDTASKLAGDIKYGVVTAIGGTAGAHTYLEIRPYPYTSQNALEV